MTLHRNAATLDGRVAVVTGGGAGIGRAVAAAFTEFGAKVSVWDSDGQGPASVAAEIGGLGCGTDVRDADQVDAALTETVATPGPPTILVNNAGGVFWSGLVDTSPNGWDALIRMNLTQVLLCTQRIACEMVEGGRAGSIINISRWRQSGPHPGLRRMPRPRRVS